MTISLDLLQILQGWLTGGVIKNLVVSEPYQANLNGQPLLVVNVSFQRIKAIIIKTNRRFEINRVWFALLRARRWSTGPWVPVGKTYEIIFEPTGEEIVTGIQSE